MFNNFKTFRITGLIRQEIPDMGVDEKKCPLCGSENLKLLPSGNFRCTDCGNSFIAKKAE